MGISATPPHPPGLGPAFQARAPGWGQTTCPEKGPLFVWMVTGLSGSLGTEDNWRCCRRVLMTPVQARLAPEAWPMGARRGLVLGCFLRSLAGAGTKLNFRRKE